MKTITALMVIVIFGCVTQQMVTTSSNNGIQEQVVNDKTQDSVIYGNAYEVIDMDKLVVMEVSQYRTVDPIFPVTYGRLEVLASIWGDPLMYNRMGAIVMGFGSDEAL